MKQINHINKEKQCLYFAGFVKMYVMLLDLSTAFDTIDHDTLVLRLQTRIGIEGPTLHWFQ